MNGRLSRAIRKGTKRAGKEYLNAIRGYPFTVRWGIAWWILFGKKL